MILLRQTPGHLSTCGSRSLLALLAIVLLTLGATPSWGRSKARRVVKKPPPESAAVDQKNRQVAVLELTALGASSDGTGISRDIMVSLERLVRANIATIEGYEVIPAVDIQMALQAPANRSIANCGGGPKCAVEVGHLVRAHVVVFGAIGALGQQYSLGLRSFDVSTGKELGRQQSLISGQRDALIYEVLVAVFQLMAPDKVRGSLVIDIDVDGVEVEIDGRSVGTTPFDKPVDNLTPGDHVVVVRRPGYSLFQQEFTIRPFETAYLKLQLEAVQN